LRSRALLLFLAVVLHGPALGPRVRADDSGRPARENRRIERLARLGKLWGTVRYMHPFLGYRDIDWDAALINAIPKVESAKTKDEFAAAVAEMLAALGDPATGIWPSESTGTPTAGESLPTWSWADGKILIVRIANDIDRDRGGPPARANLQKLKLEIGQSEGVVLDLRALTPRTGSRRSTQFFKDLSRSLVADEVVGSGERALMHSGYRSQGGMASGGYFSGFVTRDGTRFVPEPGAKARRVAFIVNARSELPPVAPALQGRGVGAVIAEGPISDAVFVTTTRVDLGEGVAARVRVTEYVAGPHCPPEIRADKEVAPSAGEGPSIPSYDAALKFVRRDLEFSNPARTSRPLPAVVVLRPDKTYKERDYPSRELRLLAAIRFWNVIHYFFPYKHLIGEDWDALLVDFLPRLEAARDAREYAMALAEMATHTHDSHVHVQARALSDYFGTAVPAVALREIEGEPVVTALEPEESAKGSGIEVGDVVVKVDGEPVRERMRRLGRYITASTPQAHTFVVLHRLLAGAPGSRVTLLVRDRDGHERERPLTRVGGGIAAGRDREGEVLRLLDGNIGYADLRRLTVGEVDGMFERFKETKAIIFDMRGYPRGTAWAIAPRINTKAARDAADFRRPLVGALSESPFHFLQPIPDRGDTPLYRGKTVMLIDERAISQSEHTGLFFEAANGTTFIGSPTMGANGDVTALTVPGDIVISFSGHDVRHADGRQLQRVGLVPHIEVRPTIRGIRDGRDEVLERAMKSLSEANARAGPKSPAQARPHGQDGVN
jgi:C-terminal processing protease CtpA/Prc